MGWEANWERKRSLSPGGQGNTSLLVSRADGTTLAVVKELKNQDSAEARTRIFQKVANLRVVHTAGAKVPRYIEGNTELFEQKDERLYFVMEYVEGETLEELIKMSGPLSLEQAIKLTIEISDSICLGHSKGTIHRDLKPKNVIVRSVTPPSAFILDYGVSFDLHESEDITRHSETIESSFLSLPEGRAPGDNRRDARSDTCALCGVLSYCLTGFYPGVLQDSSGNAPHRRQKFGLPDHLTTASRLHHLMIIFDRGFSPSADSRFQTAEELKSRLEELLSPALPDIFDDPLEMAKHVSNELRRVDRPSQLHFFSESLQQAVHQVNIFVDSNGQKLDQFIVARAGSYPTIIAKPLDRLEILPYQNSIWALSTRASRITVYIVWHFCASGAECAIHEAMYLVTSNDSVGPLSMPTPVYRWQGPTGLEQNALIAPFRRSLSSAIQLYLKAVRPSVTPESAIGHSGDSG